jgi:hypothetical protein
MSNEVKKKPLDDRIEGERKGARKPPKTVVQIIAKKEAVASPLPLARSDVSWVEPRGPPTKSEPQAFSVQEFCARNRISLSTWFKLQRTGRAPRVMRFGHVARISIEAERDWRKAMEDEAAGAEAKLEQARRVEYLAQLGKRAAKSPDHPANKRRNPARVR